MVGGFIVPYRFPPERYDARTILRSTVVRNAGSRIDADIAAGCVWAPEVADLRRASSRRNQGVEQQAQRICAAGGETVLVTDRGCVVAEIGPPRESRSPILADAMLADAVRKGWLTPALSSGFEPPRGGPQEAVLSVLLGELEGDRHDR